MEIKRVPLSKTGYERLRAELHRLETKERHQVIKAIAQARAHGDLKENAEYHAAKERQGHVEGRILDLKDKVARAEVIDCTRVSDDRAVFGTVVTLLDLDTDQEMTYQLVGAEEADVKQGKISVFAPLGQAILGKCEGDEVIALTPSGKRELEVVAISVPDEA